MAIDATWTDQQITTYLGSLDEDDRDEQIRQADNATQQRCLDLLGLSWSDLGMINFGTDDVPAEQGPAGFGQDTIAGNGLWDGRYVFSVSGGVASVFRDWDDIGTTPISSFPAPDLSEGDVGVCESRGTEWVEYGVVEPLEAEGFRGHEDFKAAQRDLDYATRSFGTRLSRLVEASGGRMTFRATSDYVVDGSDFSEVFRLLEPVATHGSIEFTRNRTRPNVFTIYDLETPTPPDGFDTTLTGTGGDAALEKLQAAIREFCEGDDYPYRDGSRIKIEVR